ncbi:titin-like [Ostrinia nubilalis]|uniref:titin-like n=1 Tax=Ostrinia nubilalis TaxID=29057 RepID=UPI00308230AD
MISTGLVLFLFGIAVSAGPYIPRAKPPTEIVITKHSSHDKVTEYEHLPSSGGSPVISNFIQKGTNVFFKPQFMLAAAQMPPQVQSMIAEIEQDDCKTRLPMGPIPMLMEEPLQVVEQEIVASSKPIIKETIEINPVAYTQHVVQPTLELKPFVPSVSEGHVMELHRMHKIPVVVEESIKLEEPCLHEEEEHVVIPEAPVLTPYVPHLEIPKPVIIEAPETVAVVEVPPAPVLPPLELPMIPREEVAEIIVKEKVPEVVVPSFIPESYVREVVVTPPEAPVLPPYIQVEVPKPVIEGNFIETIEIPAAPVLSEFEMPKLPVLVEEHSVVPCLHGEEHHEIEIKTVEVPTAPVLPPYVPDLPEIVVEEKPLVVPEAPVLPPYVPVSKPISVVVEKEMFEATPVLPAFEMPGLTVEIEKTDVIPCPPNEEQNEVIVVEEKHVYIPEAPVLPPLSLPELPVNVEIHENVHCDDTVEVVEPVLIPSAPVLPPLEIPKVPMVIEEAHEIVAPCPPELEMEKVVIESKPQIARPVAYMSQEILTDAYVRTPIVMSSAPEFLVPYFPVVTENVLKEDPTSCVHDIVVERILPRLEKSIQIKDKRPVSAYLSPVRYAMF